MRVTIKSAEVHTRNVKRTRDQREFVFREQDAYATIGDEVRRIPVPLQDNQAPYAVGQYELMLEQSLYVDRNGRLALGRLVLKPVMAAASANAG